MKPLFGFEPMTFDAGEYLMAFVNYQLAHSKQHTLFLYLHNIIDSILFDIGFLDLVMLIRHINLQY